VTIGWPAEFVAAVAEVAGKLAGAPKSRPSRTPSDSKSRAATPTRVSRSPPIPLGHPCTWLIFRRDMALSLRKPAWIMIGIMQPLLYLFLFRPMFTKVATNTPGFPPGNGWMVLGSARERASSDRALDCDYRYAAFDLEVAFQAI
jgi:hypothetical protein